MDESQLRVPGKAPRLENLGWTPLIAITLAAIAVLYVVKHSQAPQAVLPITKAQSGPIAELPGEAPIAAAATNVPATSPDQVPGPASAESDSKWRPAPLQERVTEPGITLAELCAASSSRLHCQTTKTRHGGDSAAGGVANPVGQVIAGRVLLSDGTVLPGATVVATPERLHEAGPDSFDAMRYQTVTDLDGSYELNGLPEGEYVVRASADEHYQPARLMVRTGVRYADLVLVEEQQFVIQGRVLSDIGEPLEGVTVLPFLLGLPSVKTDEAGHYYLPVALRPGTRAFAVRFRQPGFLEQFRSVDVETLKDTGMGSVEVRLQPIDYLTAVSGIVTGSDGENLAGREVTLRPRNEQRVYSTVTDADGEFFFEAVEAPADYRLNVSGAPDHTDHQQEVRVTLDNTELSIVVEPFQFGRVAGRLINAEGNPVPDFNLVLRNEASKLANIVVSTDANGNFAVPDVPAGKLVVATQSDPSILVRGIELDGGAELHLPLIVDWGRHELRGMVVDAAGNPVPASRVILNWMHEADGIVTRATRRTAADAQGQFAFSDLGPGPHSLTIDAPGHLPVALEHDLRQQGYDVTVRLN
jgi:hypothetical protein